MGQLNNRKSTSVHTTGESVINRAKKNTPILLLPGGSGLVGVVDGVGVLGVVLGIGSERK